MFGPSPWPPIVAMERIIEVVELNRGKPVGDFESQLAEIRRTGRGEVRFWSSRMFGDGEYANVFEDPEAVFDPSERTLADDPDGAEVYADWLEGHGRVHEAEFLRARLAGKAERMRDLARRLDVTWLSLVHGNTSTVLHFAAATSSPQGSGTAAFCSRSREYNPYREQMMAFFEAIAITLDVTHFIAGENLFDWRLFDAQRFLDGPDENLHPRHIAWRRDVFEASDAARWGSFNPREVVEGSQFDRVQLW